MFQLGDNFPLNNSKKNFKLPSGEKKTILSLYQEE